MSPDHQGGLLLIPDISGFTQFVSEVEISHSEHVIAELLELLINGNRLGLELCEIEGDALFFYKQGALPDFETMLEQVNHWTRSFHGHLKLLERDNYCQCGACQNIGNLGLKVVGHIGEFSIYAVKKKIKIIGKDVILVHRLLKNHVEGQNYVLYSRALSERLGSGRVRAAGFQERQESYETFGDVPVDFLDLTQLVAEVPDPPPREIQRLPREFSMEIEIDGTLEDAAKLILNHAGWPDWVAGLEQMVVDQSAPIRVGHHHVCVFPGNPLSITLEHLIQDKDEFTFVNNIVPPPLLHELKFIFEVRTVGGGISVKYGYAYAPKFLGRRKFEKDIVPMLTEEGQATLQNLKAKIEGGAAAG